jgi:endonuclease-3
MIKYINKIFQIFQQINPNPTTELIYNSNFELLIAVVLSAQSTDIMVNKVTANLFKKYNTPQKILGLGIDGLKQYIKTIGLFNTKAQNIIKLCQKLINDFDSIVPNNFNDLIKLDGVGRKTANVILNTLYGTNDIAVDTHVYRVSRRIGLSNKENIIELEQDLYLTIPKKYQKNAHHWLILHGRYICSARKPKCNECSINKYCKFYNIL